MQVPLPGMAKLFVSQSTFSADFLILFAHLYNSSVQSYASLSVSILKIPSTDTYTIVWTLENTAHTKSALEDGLWLHIIVVGGIKKKLHTQSVSPQMVSYPHKRAMQKLKIPFQCTGFIQKNYFLLFLNYCLVLGNAVSD